MYSLKVLTPFYIEWIYFIMSYGKVRVFLYPFSESIFIRIDSQKNKKLFTFVTFQKVLLSFQEFPPTLSRK